MKKLLLITFILFFSFSFAQQSEKSSGVANNNPPVTLLLVSAYPNPFSQDTSINFRSTKVQTIIFTVKNLLGTTVYEEQINASSGYNAIPFNRNSLTKGMYIYSLQTDAEIISKRLIIK